MSRVRVKICGITSVHDARHAVQAGADYLGFTLFPPSPRSISPEDAAEIIADLSDQVECVALTVDADDELMLAAKAAGVGWIQMHGTEPPERVAEIRARTELKVMKAIGVRSAFDVDKIADYEAVADQILVDAKPPKGAAVPGGHGVTFDWRLINGRKWSTPWMLAGGLNPANVAEAINLTAADQVDVASGVESSPGVKDQAKVTAFLAAARAVK